MKTINTFNNNIILFLEQLYNITQNKLFIEKNDMCKTILKFNKKYIINLFIQYIVPYEKYITNRNILILNELQKLELFQNISLNNLWINLEETNKNICWSYLDTFIILSKNYLNK